MRNITRLLVLIGLLITSQLSAQTLLHYWNFNTTTSYQAHLAPTASTITGAAIDTFLYSGGSALVDVANGTGQGFDLNNYNARNGDVAGTHLRFNNPIYGALRFSLPTTGYKDVVVKYASIRSGSGAYYQFVHYTTDGTNYTLFDTIEPTTTPTLYTLDFSSIPAANNNPNFKVRITFGQGGGGTAGNNRIDNFTMEGNQYVAPALVHYWNFNTTSSYVAHLATTSSVVTGAAIDTFLYTGGSALVDVANGTGQGFDLNNYNARNGDVAGTHLRFNNPIYGALRFSLPTTGYENIVVKYASIRSGSGAYYQFVHYTTDGTNYTLFDTIEPTTTPTLYTLDFSSIPAANNNPNFKVRITFGQGGGGTAGNNRIDNFTLEGTPYVPASLVHYWNFNTTTSYAAHLAANTSLVTGAAIDTFLYSGGSALVDVANGTGQGFDLNNYNARNGDVAGTHLRFNNPIYGALRFSLPTTGYKDVVVKYASIRSGSGAYYQFVHYTTDGTNYILFDTIEPTTTPTLYTLDFSGIAATDNNPNFKVRITFGQGGGGTAGNNRIDNFTLEGYSINGGDAIAPTAILAPLNNSLNIATNAALTFTFSEDVRLFGGSAPNNNNVDTIVELRLNDSAGTMVSFDASISGKIITITPAAALANNQQYYMALKANRVEDMAGNAIVTVSSVKFKTIALQTVFQAGDLVPVAYRMNATATDDEVALLTFVDILPGTIINFTDAKYTDNTPAQCPGGIVWTAPATGVAAGTVISIKNDAGTANIGTITGSNFGLSSGGDQFTVYTGTNLTPTYITALSSNNWLSANTVCSGSESKRPAALTDGVSSIQFSTAKGSVAGNTANSYYNGTQTGSIAQLRAAILDTVNWIGAASGTAPQAWPSWAFPGPPVITSATVVNATTIRLIFNRELDSVSAKNMANYTGIAGLSAITRTNNGLLADTVLLTYSTAFASGSSNILTVANIKDNENRTMFTPYVFNFTYNTSIAFARKFVSVKEDTGSVSVQLNITNPGTSSVQLVVKGAPFSTATAADYTLATQTLTFTGATNSLQTITIPIINDSIREQDEYFVVSLENASGLTITGSPLFTVYIRDNDNPAPVAQKNVELSYVGSFQPNSIAGSTTEIVVYDSATKRLYMTSAIQDRLDIADFSNPANITLIRSINMAPYGGITSVAVKNGIVAVASPNANEQLNGSVVLFNTDGDSLKRVTVGALPDMITFTPDGKKILTANEGQPNDAYTVDPEGSISVIDISGGINTLTQSNVTTLDFTSFNAQETALRTQGVRKLKLSSTLSQDFEPEYVTISADSKKAWATLQENNAIAEIDLLTNTIISVWAMGTKDYSAAGNGYDASDNSGYVHLSNYPVKGFYIPDAIANYSVGNAKYLITANEGDEKEYSGLNERTTVGASTTVLDSAKFPHAAWLKEDFNLGRFRVTNLNGDTDGDGDFDELYCNGARSFTIWNADTKTKVYDSGDDFERITSTDPSIALQFNADNESNGMKSRSRAKGPEPEGLTTAKIGGQQFVFVGLERVGGVMVYNITDPANVKYEDYKNSRGLTSFTGDHGPEGITYISPAQSPDGKAYITVANEISGTISVYEVKNKIPPAQVVFAEPVSSVPEQTATKTVRLSITPKAQENGTIIVRVTNSANVTAADYTTTPAITGTDSIILQVNQMDTMVSFTVNITNDTLDEANENITFEIQSAAGMTIGSAKTHTLTILDNDTTIPPAIVTFKEATRSVSENSGATTVSLKLNAPHQGNGTIVVKATNGTNITAADYSTLPALTGDSILIPVSNQDSLVTFTVTVNDDILDEQNETITFEVRSVTAGMTIGLAKTYTLTIIDNDTTILPSVITFTQATQSALENSGSATVTLQLNAPVNGSGQVVIKPVNGTGALSTDYSTTPAIANDSIIVNLANGATSASFDIALTNDTLIETDEQIIFSLVRVSSNLTIGPANSFTFTILNDDSLPPTAVNELLVNGRQIRMYPNPNDIGKVFFTEAVDVEVYDLTGKLLMQESNAAALDLAPLAKGIYMIRIEGTVTKKLIVE